MSKFSIVVPHYQGTVTHKQFCRGVNSILAQTCGGYEILCYHDGPLLDPRLPFPVPVRPTEVRHNDFGHSLRDRGIREATGEYVLFFNPDNLLYPTALELIGRTLAEPALIFDEEGRCLDRPDVVIFPILMRGVKVAHKRLCRFPDPAIYTIFTGVPVRRHNIDCMQFVMRRELWVAEGGWADKSHDGDGIMYERLAAKYGYRTVPEVLGEHW
jgi:hypothetical protein